MGNTSVARDSVNTSFSDINNHAAGTDSNDVYGDIVRQQQRDGAAKAGRTKDQSSDQSKNQFKDAGSDPDGGFFGHLRSSFTKATRFAMDTGLKAATEAALPVVAITDSLAHTHVVDAIDDVVKGAVKEVVDHPGTIIKDAAIGAGVVALTVATGGGLAVGLAIAGGAAAGMELYKHRGHGAKGELDGMISDAKGVAGTAKEWAHDAAVIASSGPHKAKEDAVAKAGLERAGAFVADTAASAAGGMLGAGLMSVMLTSAAASAEGSAVSGTTSVAAESAAADTSTAAGVPRFSNPEQVLMQQVREQGLSEFPKASGADLEFVRHLSDRAAAANYQSPSDYALHNLEDPAEIERFARLYNQNHEGALSEIKAAHSGESEDLKVQKAWWDSMYKIGQEHLKAAQAASPAQTPKLWKPSDGWTNAQIIEQDVARDFPGASGADREFAELLGLRAGAAMNESPARYALQNLRDPGEIEQFARLYAQTHPADGIETMNSAVDTGVVYGGTDQAWRAGIAKAATGP